MLAEFQPLLSGLKSALRGEEGIAAIVVFGSVARQEAAKDSDLDLCIFISKKDRLLEKRISDTLLELEKKFDRNIQLVLLAPGMEGCDRQLIDTILREGAVIAGEFPPIPIQKLQLEPYSIIRYDLSSLSHSDKMRVKRLLYGKKTTKKVKGKTYISERKGILRESRGMRVGIASILLPEQKSREVEKMLRGLGVQTRRIGAWLAKV